MQSFIFKIFPKLPVEVNAIIAEYYYRDKIFKLERQKICYIYILDCFVSFFDHYESEDLDRLRIQNEIFEFRQSVRSELFEIMRGICRLPLVRQLKIFSQIFEYITKIPINYETIHYMKVRYGVLMHNIHCIDQQLQKITNYSYKSKVRSVQFDDEYYYNNLYCHTETVASLIEYA